MRVWLGTGMAVLVLASACSGPAAALSISEPGGGEAWLTGTFEPGDGASFERFLARPRATPLRVVYLNSHGGNLKAGLDIARAVRRAGLATAVLAERHVCDSACTLVFVAGVRRHYVNGGAVYEGLSGLSGLGFHPAHRRGDMVRPSMRTDAGTERVRAHYAEMGVPRAGELMDRAAINTLYRPSGQTTLQLGIATSLAAP